MERRQVLKTAGVLATGGVTSLAGCSSSGNGDGGGEPTTTETEGTTGDSREETTGGSGGSNTVMMVTEGSEYYFDPIGLFVESGDTVTFEIQSGSHSATAYKEGTSTASVNRIPEGAEPFNSEILSEQGASYEHTFETTGTYDYFCIPHKSLGMVGRIVVGEPGGPAEGSMPPDGDVPESQTIVDKGNVSYSEFTE
ncbi:MULTISPECIES: plastocyanin/azurin family copper-binding protein [unclassified Haloferax]|uniref:plastocyanin/azurin family copper-binding protein n=1 Tax=unclassified Haloferax TaxID=2625095 RepID=UPI000E25CC07|nr:MULTISPECIES: plastocyanin/azurin family copper-binding protein [unclassified Haloferax]MDS0243706.1 plastocyanin/azurin family copper-binding protein [Haloferax sp. S2CR25]MDS0446827.1 plastocyanin/azurin family copper-binding protein [Haloferax sp. S2CR25-2]RDZ39590.1 halocyanin [Haloferax sp. Atlit-16N]RDZ53757.1 halocyanin [Haloferax sp. Atlit-10N]